jgi:hypothetical protein
MPEYPAAEHAAPIHTEPHSLHPPYRYLPDGPHRRGESNEEFRTRRRHEALEALLAPLAGLELTDYERRQLQWLAGWETGTVATIAALLHRARQSR